VTTLALTRVEPDEFESRRPAIAALDGAARAIAGHDAVGDAVWRDLGAPHAESVGFLIDSRAYVHVARAEPGGAGAHWTAGAIRLPAARDRETTSTLLDAAVAHVAAHGGGRLECWVLGVTEGDDAPFADAGFTVARSLFEMRVPLPRPEAPHWPPGLGVRTFDRERDGEAWLAVNNRAFADHPDQGGWTEATLRERMAESWFDPTLFLLAADADGLAGFNWLKLHSARDPDPVLGEIYVIGVDPRAQGTGLGRALAVAGLQAVHDRGAPVGMLFCASDNAGALALYRSLGFEVHRTDRAYAREVAPAVGEPA
jgi:mycothiol synthase